MKRPNADERGQDQHSDLIYQVQKNNQSVPELKFLSAIKLNPVRNCITEISPPGYSLH